MSCYHSKGKVDSVRKKDLIESCVEMIEYTMLCIRENNELYDKESSELSILKLFAICHVLREFGYRKESAKYFVKPKGGKPVILDIEERNCWHIKHYDFNSRNRYVKEMGGVSGKFGYYGVFSEFNKDGYICTIPLENQIIEFAKIKGFELSNIKNLSLTLHQLVIAYREEYKDITAFNKYLELANKFE